MPKVVCTLTADEVLSTPLLHSLLHDMSVQTSNGPNGFAYHLTAVQRACLADELYQQVDLLTHILNRLYRTQ